jgi:hypothetical protein
VIRRWNLNFSRKALLSGIGLQSFCLFGIVTSMCSNLFICILSSSLTSVFLSLFHSVHQSAGPKVKSPVTPTFLSLSLHVHVSVTILSKQFFVR